MNMNRTRSSIGHAVALAVVGVVFVTGADVTMTKIGEYSISVNGCGGITYAGGNQYYAVRDHNDNNLAELYPLTININPSTGEILSHSFDSPIELIGNGDSEGVAYDPGQSLYDRLERLRRNKIKPRAYDRAKNVREESALYFVLLEIPHVFENRHGDRLDI